MPSKNKLLSKARLAAIEARRNLAAELLESVRQMKAGRTQVVTSPVAKVPPGAPDEWAPPPAK